MTTADNGCDELITNGAIDIAKFVLEILVIGIHTEPFGFNFLLDKGFGICTRLCVPFFFITSAYFFWRNTKAINQFLKRILLLYVIWSIIYLPFDLKELSQMTFSQILRWFFWNGNEHGLWYLWGTVIGFGIVHFLLKFFEPKHVLVISLFLLFAGTLKSTYSTAVNQIFGIRLMNHLGSRNGLFYGLAYIALGMTIAKSATKGFFRSRKGLYAGFVISMLLLAVESYLFVIVFKADSTILWMSVFPSTYFLFEILLNSKIRLNKTLSHTIRKMSTLMYVSQHLFIHPLSRVTTNMLLFIITVLATILLSFIVLKLSEMKQFRFLQYLY